MVALRNGIPDRVPIIELTINDSVLAEMANILGLEVGGARYSGKKEDDLVSDEKVGAKEDLELYAEVIEALGLDATCYGLSIGLKRIDSNHAEDKFGRIFHLSPHGEPLPMEPRIKDTTDLANYDMSGRLSSEDFIALSWIVDYFGDDRAHFMTINDPFKIGWRTRGGMQNFLMDFYRNPDIVKGLVDKAKDYLLLAIEKAVDIGIDGFIMGGDYADEGNLIISPEHYREYFKPVHEVIISKIHELGAKIVKHSDGNVWKLMGDFIEVGFDGFHPVQPQCMDIIEVKEYLDNRMAIIGNIDCRSLLVTGTPEEVDSVVKETIKKTSPGGGYIISSSNSIHPNVKPENYIAMVEAAKQYGDY